MLVCRFSWIDVRLLVVVCVLLWLVVIVLWILFYRLML